MDKSLEIAVKSSQALREMYETCDELGILRRYSEGLGEVEVCIHNKWFLFYVDKRVLDDERALDEAFEDAERVADSYWRQ